MAKSYDYQSAFDIIGPVMMGPSSSHTAGAVKIGNSARAILGDIPKNIEIEWVIKKAKAAMMNRNSWTGRRRAMMGPI